ncbi:MAG: hypothetical protein K8T25_06650, partial [Planctomycetia bacterium]|nr:hypothetical protein [Planctomycetia bacterium]
CLQYDPALRPASAAALALELRQCRTPLRRARRWSIAHQVFVCALLAVSAAGAIGGALYWWQRDPYDQRQYIAAQAAFAHKDNVAAMSYATNAIAAKPQRADALELRAFARMASSDFSGALLDIQAAANGKPSARLLALQGYCQYRLKLYVEAGACYQQAVADGYKRPDGWNNLAFYHCNFGNLTEAKRLLDIAAADPSAPYQVYLNRAIVELKFAYKNQPHDLPAAIHDVERAIQLNGPNADMELLAARLSATAARNDAAYVADSLSHLEKACSLGLATKPMTLSADPDFAALRSQPRFQQVMGRLPTSTMAPPPERIIAPSFKD